MTIQSSPAVSPGILTFAASDFPQSARRHERKQAGLAVTSGLVIAERTRRAEEWPEQKGGLICVREGRAAEPIVWVWYE